MFVRKSGQFELLIMSYIPFYFDEFIVTTLLIHNSTSFLSGHWKVKRATTLFTEIVNRGPHNLHRKVLIYFKIKLRKLNTE